MSTTTGISLLSTIDAHKSSITARQNEMNGYSTEKTNLQSEIVTIETKTLPELRAEKKSLEILYDEQVEDNKTAISDAYKKAYVVAYGTAAYNLAQANKTFDANQEQAEDNYEAAKVEHSKWKGWYANGCKSNYGSFEGAYCGKRAVACTNKSKGDFNQLAPSRCLKSQYRDARNNHAKNMTASSLVTQNNTYAAQQKSYIKPYSLKNAESNVASAITSYNNSKDVTEPMKTTKTAITNKNFEIAQYVKTNGVIDKKNQRIAFIDAKISSIVKTISEIGREKYLAEQEYQTFLQESAKENEIIENAIKDENLRRDNEVKVLDASIKVNSKEVENLASPEFQAMTIKKDSNNKVFIIAGAIVLLAGVYLIKKK